MPELGEWDELAGWHRKFVTRRNTNVNESESSTLTVAESDADSSHLVKFLAAPPSHENDARNPNPHPIVYKNSIKDLFPSAKPVDVKQT